MLITPISVRRYANSVGFTFGLIETLSAGVLSAIHGSSADEHELRIIDYPRPRRNGIRTFGRNYIIKHYNNIIHSSTEYLYSCGAISDVCDSPIRHGDLTRRSYIYIIRLSTI